MRLPPIASAILAVYTNDIVVGDTLPSSRCPSLIRREEPSGDLLSDDELSVIITAADIEEFLEQLL